MKIDSKGESRFGCLIAVLLLVIAIYCSIKIIPPYYNSVQFLDETEATVTKAAVYNWPDEKIYKTLIRSARNLNQPVFRKNIRIFKTGYNLIVELNYYLPIDLSFYKFNLKRSARFSGLRGATF